MHSTYIFSRVCIIHVSPFIVSFRDEGGCEWISLYFLYSYRKCKLVTITLRQCLTTQLTHARSRTSLSFLLSLFLPAATGTPYSPARFPAITMMTTTSSLFPFSLTPLSLFLYLHGSCLSLSLCIPAVITVPFRRAVCYLPSRVPFASSSLFLIRCFYRTDIVIDRVKCIS